MKLEIGSLIPSTPLNHPFNYIILLILSKKIISCKKKIMTNLTGDTVPTSSALDTKRVLWHDAVLCCLTLIGQGVGSLTWLVNARVNHWKWRILGTGYRRRMQPSHVGLTGGGVVDGMSRYKRNILIMTLSLITKLLDCLSNDTHKEKYHSNSSLSLAMGCDLM